MENITIGELSLGIAFLVSLISGGLFLHGQLKKYIGSQLKDEFQGINDRLDHIDGRLDVVDMEACKNYLVQFLSRVERDIAVDEIERERFYEQFAHYEKMGGNSYIKQKVNKLQAEGKL